MDIRDAVRGFAPKAKSNGTGHPYLYVSYAQREAMIQHIAKKYGTQLKADDCAGLSIVTAMLWKADGANVDPNDTPNNKRK